MPLSYHPTGKIHVASPLRRFSSLVWTGPWTCNPDLHTCQVPLPAHAIDQQRTNRDVVRGEGGREKFNQVWDEAKGFSWQHGTDVQSGCSS